MKKYNTFKILFIALGIMAILSWIIPGSTIGETVTTLPRETVGLWDIFQYPIAVFRYFTPNAIFILVVGGFYGIINETGVYKNILNAIVKKFKNKEKLFLIITMILIAIITSLAGLNIPLILIFPFIISLLLLMGYDRLTILVSTVGSFLVGIIGSTYSNSVNGSINYVLGIDYRAEILSKVFLLLISLLLLVIYVLNNKKENAKLLGKKFEDPYYINKKTTNKNIKGLVIVLITVPVIMLLSSLNWNSAFGIRWFEVCYNKIMSFEVFNVKIFSNLLGNMVPFGYWGIIEFTVLLLIASITLVLIYKIKTEDALDAFIAGSKKMAPIALITVLAYIPILITSYHPYLITVSNWLLKITPKFNILTFIATTSIGSVLMVDLHEYILSIAPLIKTVVTDTAVYPVIGFLMQSIYGLVMFAAPTSILLLGGIVYLDIPYKTWLKYIYKLLLQILIIIIIMSTIIV
ncbi:MAG: hypothetical protein PHS45_00655, partial [Bacilli bacterium]|nr:hypothetical protein [Bacilli bacterium]